jgi:hypothetical protein
MLWNPFGQVSSVNAAEVEHASAETSSKSLNPTISADVCSVSYILDLMVPMYLQAALNVCDTVLNCQTTIMEIFSSPAATRE